MEISWRIAGRYFREQRLLLLSPMAFVQSVDFAAGADRSDAAVFLLLGGTYSLVIARINTALLDDRIRRLIRPVDTLNRHVLLFAAVATFGVFMYATYHLLKSRASLVSTIAALAYVVAFTAPVLSLLLVLVSRLESATLGATFVAAPPYDIMQLGAIPHTTSSVLLAGAFSTILVGWNLYFAWNLWSVFTHVNGLTRFRGAVGLLSAAALFAIAADRLERVVDISIEPLRPIWELFFGA